MSKLLWVMLPLLAVAAVLAVQVLRGRTPSRHALNAVSSVLLLVYLLATAGLGLFWVANQQLPVFDWHYLFGYGTVLLVTLHLAFNFRVVWRFFTRRRRRAPNPEPHRATGLPRGARRSALKMLGGALLASVASGAAYMFGLRSGRREQGPFEAPLAANANAAAATSALGFVERFHSLTSHSRAGVLMQAPVVDWGPAPPPFKQDGASQALASALRLPPPGRSRETPFDLRALADMLWHTAGVTEARGGLFLRASPSSGALFATELYVAARSLPGLTAGLWHHDARSHALVPLHDATAVAMLQDAVFDEAARDAPALVVATSVFRRSGRKYGDRTYRYVLADLGHALENLRVAASALGVSMRLVAAFDEARAARAISVDEAEEGVLAVAALGVPEVAALGVPGLSAAAPIAGATQLRPSSPSAQAPALGATSAMHAATSLRVALAPQAAASATASSQRSAPPSLVTLPPASPLTPDWLTVIAKRRSVRRFAKAPLPLPTLAGVLLGMSARHAPMLSRAVRVSLVSNDVVGLAPGAWRYEPQRHALVPRRVPMDLRAAAGAAGLDQDVITDAAVVFVLAIDRATFAADPLGPARGYRHAYLEAGARGLGACGVGAFYDDEAAALIGLDAQQEWVVHFAALGAKA
jgi:SagB-type dehydrogenase family enzyme